MANIPITDGLNTRFYLAADGAAVDTAANCVTAISTAEQIENMTTFGDVDLGTYAVQTLSVFGGDMAKSFGSKTVGNIAVTIIFDALNTSGQADLLLMHSTKTYRTLIIQYDDTGAGTGGTPTYVTCRIGAATMSMPTPIDSSIMINATFELMEIPALIPATLGS